MVGSDDDYGSRNWDSETHYVWNMVVFRSGIYIIAITKPGRSILPSLVVGLVHVGLFLCMIGGISLTPMLLWLCYYIYSQPVDDKRGKWLTSCFFKLNPEDALDFPSWTTYHLRGAVKTYYKCYPNREFYCIVDTLDRENSRDAAGERQSFLEIRRHFGLGLGFLLSIVKVNQQSTNRLVYVDSPLR